MLENCPLLCNMFFSFCAKISDLTEKSAKNVDILQSKFTNTLTHAKKNKIMEAEGSKKMYREL